MSRLKDIKAAHHAEGMKDPIYAAGHAAYSETSKPTDNPYPYPEEICRERRTLVCKPGHLNDEEREQLRGMNERMNNTEWSRWASGYWANPRLREED